MVRELEEAFISMCRNSRVQIFISLAKLNNKCFSCVTAACLRYGSMPLRACLCTPEGHKHGVSIQICINLGDTLLRIAREWKPAENWLLARLFILQSSIISQSLEFIHWMVTNTNFSFDRMTDKYRELVACGDSPQPPKLVNAKAYL